MTKQNRPTILRSVDQPVTPIRGGGLALGLNSAASTSPLSGGCGGEDPAPKPADMITLKDVQKIELLDSGALEITFTSLQSLIIDGQGLQEIHASIGLSEQSEYDQGAIASLPSSPNAIAKGPANFDQVLARGSLRLDVVRHTCLWKEQPIPLTRTEFQIVRILAEHPGHVKTRDQLMDATWGREVAVFDRNIDSHLKRIRKKFRAIDDDFRCIQTLYGIGYKFVVDV